MKKTWYGALAIIAFLGLYTPASHLHASRSEQILASGRLTIPDNSAIRRPAFQRGIDIDAYTYRGQDISAAAADVVAYVKKLHANSLSISFPFFMSKPAVIKSLRGPKDPDPDPTRADHRRRRARRPLRLDPAAAERVPDRRQPDHLAASPHVDLVRQLPAAPARLGGLRSESAEKNDHH